jgi:hypothetical protein
MPVEDLKESLNFVCDRLLIKCLGAKVPVDEIAAYLVQPESDSISYQDLKRALSTKL